MTRTPRTAGAATAALVAAVALLVLTSGCAAVHQGDVQPADVEKKGHAFVQQTLAAIGSVTATPRTAVFDEGWTKCATETPGQHRFDYSYAVRADVPAAKVKAALSAVKAEYLRHSYTLEYLPHPESGVSATLPKSNWHFGVDASGTTTLSVSVDSDCVFTRHAPKTVK
ncbi:hypothetical protein [Actinacidiphila yeochonensis]|uniref:hypothetical protein n=1 Tax=Actinacidiphila yeochonensis TaxID=89050 RepID=UPI00055C7974|nr:hypothetical protein [Actinacidiphila yeochonensis]